MHWYEDEVAGMERHWAQHPPPTGAVVCYGSSSMRLWDTVADDLPVSPVVNAAFGGSTLAACAYFCKRLVVPLRPRAVVVYAGDNDLGDGRSPADVRAAWVDLVGQLDAALGPLPLAFISIKPSPARWHLMGRIREANSLVAGELAARPHSLYIDVVEPMLGPDGRPRPELYADDGLHLGRAGYDLWREVVGPRVARLA